MRLFRRKKTKTKSESLNPDKMLTLATSESEGLNKEISSTQIPVAHGFNGFTAAMKLAEKLEIFNEAYPTARFYGSELTLFIALYNLFTLEDYVEEVSGSNETFILNMCTYLAGASYQRIRSDLSNMLSDNYGNIAAQRFVNESYEYQEYAISSLYGKLQSHIYLLIKDGKLEEPNLGEYNTKKQISHRRTKELPISFNVSAEIL